MTRMSDPTRYLPGPVIEVPPILQLIRPATGCTQRTRPPARRRSRAVHCAVQLGSQRNFDFEDVPRLITQDLVRAATSDRPDRQSAGPADGREWPSGSLDEIFIRLPDCLDAIDLMVTQRRLQQLSRMRFWWRAGDLRAERSSGNGRPASERRLCPRYRPRPSVAGVGISRVRAAIDIAMSEIFVRSFDAGRRGSTSSTAQSRRPRRSSNSFSRSGRIFRFSCRWQGCSAYPYRLGRHRRDLGARDELFEAHAEFDLLAKFHFREHAATSAGERTLIFVRS